MTGVRSFPNSADVNPVRLAAGDECFVLRLNDIDLGIAAIGDMAGHVEADNLGIDGEPPALIKQ